VASELDAKPTVEALEEERRRLKELERNLATERTRIQEAAAREISRMQAALKEAADRAGKREQELERTQRKLDRTGRGGRLAAFGLAARTSGHDESIAQREAQADERERALAAAAAELEHETARLRELEASLAASRVGVEQAEALAAETAALEARNASLDEQVAELVEAERRSAELLAARAAALESRAQDLDARSAELEAEAAGLRERREALEAERPRAPGSEGVVAATLVAADLRIEHERLEAKAKTLQEAEQRFAEARAEAAAREEALRSAEAAAAAAQAVLDARAAEVADHERQAAELDDRATVLAARETEISESAAEIDRRERELAGLRTELESEQQRLAERAHKLTEAERRAPVRRLSAPPMTFGEGIRALSRRSSG
jgi:chromosome segregation ATPase